MVVVQFFIWMGLAALLYLLLGFWLADKFRTERLQESRRAKRWNYTRATAAYLAVTVAILTTAAWIPHSRNIEYDNGRYATHDAFNEGWIDGCDYLMSTSDGNVWYYDDKTYDQQWCESLNQVTEDRNFFYDYPPRRLPEGTTVDEYEQMARNTAANLALRTAFSAQPTLCFADECWDWDRMYFHIIDSNLDRSLEYQPPYDGF
jgi:hypothetical protein